MFQDTAKPSEHAEPPRNGGDESRAKPPFPPMMMVREGFFRTVTRPVTHEEVAELTRKAEKRNRSWF